MNFSAGYHFLTLFLTDFSIRFRINNLNIVLGMRRNFILQYKLLNIILLLTLSTVNFFFTLLTLNNLCLTFLFLLFSYPFNQMLSSILLYQMCYFRECFLLILLYIIRLYPLPRIQLFSLPILIGLTLIGAFLLNSQINCIAISSLQLFRDQIQRSLQSLFLLHWYILSSDLLL